MAVDVVPGSGLTVHQAIGGAVRFPPATHEVAGRAVVDAAVDRAAEGGVALVASGPGPTNGGVRSRGTKHKLEGCDRHRRRCHRQLRQKAPPRLIRLSRCHSRGVAHELRHVLTPSRCAASVRMMNDRKTPVPITSSLATISNPTPRTKGVPRKAPKLRRLAVTLRNT